MILLSLSFLPLPLNGIMNGLILYGLLRYYTLGRVKPLLGDQVYDPLPAISTVLGILIGGFGLALRLVQNPVPIYFSWLPAAGATLVLYSVGMPFLRGFLEKKPSA